MVQAYRHFVRAFPVSSAPIDTLSGPFKRLTGGTEYVLSRRFCSFRSKKIESRRLTRDLVRSVILEAVTASAYTDALAYVTSADNTLGVWTWDNDDLVGVLPSSARRQAVPETLYHRPVEGFALRSCIEGVEGQFWQSGALIASRWWPQSPSASEWSVFRRAVGVATAEDDFVPPPITQGFDKSTRRPRNLTPISDRIKLVSPKEIGLLFASALSIPSIYFLASAANLSLEARSLGTQKQKLEEATKGRAQLSRDIAEMRQELTAFQGLFRTNDPLSSLEAVVREVTARNGEVQRLTFQEGMLSIQFETEGALDEREFVSALEAQSSLREATVRRQGDKNIWTVDAAAISAAEGRK